jgi:ribulose 1,5-bisphosphate synthetase/thiazole synthase
MQDDARTHGLWQACAVPGPAVTLLEERIKVDVVVVGAGYTGLSCALHLAEGGASVTA